jgi:2-methylcitrate dehydratase PrpD
MTAVRALGEWVAGLRWSDVPVEVRERLILTLQDTVAVTIAGARTAELEALRSATAAPDGEARVFGAARSAPVDQAAWLNATAACSLELDEGNKFARGHPAAHAFPAALALAEARGARGEELCAALLAGHEVAARLGRATRLPARVHPHGNWGVAGAAAAAARLLGMDGAGVAAAIDAAGALALAGPFEAAVRGSFVRNTWLGAANVNGLVAARLAQAGLARVDGLPAVGLGLLGDFDSTALDERLGERFDVMHGYFKRHASCSFTHPPADAALELREREPRDDWADAREVRVETHAIAATLDGRQPATRLAAMFSVPYVTAVALLEGDCSPARFSDDERGDAELRALIRRVTVTRSDRMDARLPDERAARVTVALAGGRELSAEVANPVGDADHRPFGPAEIAAKAEALLAPHDIDAEELHATIAELPASGNAATVLRRLP